MHSNQDTSNGSNWWSAISLRIAHKNLDPAEITQKLEIAPTFAFLPGDSQVCHQDSKSAGYWCGGKRVYDPIRPTELIDWIETVAETNKSFLESLIDIGADITVYLGIHLDAASLGFDLPKTPILNLLGIKIGIEIFSR